MNFNKVNKAMKKEQEKRAQKIEESTKEFLKEHDLEVEDVMEGDEYAVKYQQEANTMGVKAILYKKVDDKEIKV